MMGYPEPHAAPAQGLHELGSVRSGRIHWNLSPAALYEEALRRGEAQLAAEGPIVARTGQHTGRSPNDKFVVREAQSEQHVHWGTVNRPFDEAKFDAVHRDMMTYVQDKELYVLDAWAEAAGADEESGGDWGFRWLAEQHADELRALLKRLIKEHKPGDRQPQEPLKALVRGAMSFDMPDGRAEEAMRAIDREFVDLNPGFEMPIERPEGKFKLGQNRSAEDQAGIRVALHAQGGSVAELLELMQRYRTP